MEQLGKKATWSRRLGLICCLALLLGLIVFENSCGLLQYRPRRSRTGYSASRAPEEEEESRVEEISLLVEGEGPDSSSMSKVQLVPLWPNNDTYKVRQKIMFFFFLFFLHRYVIDYSSPSIITQLHCIGVCVIDRA